MLPRTPLHLLLLPLPCCSSCKGGAIDLSQPSITDALAGNMSATTSVEVNLAWAQAFIGCGIPLSVADNPHFKRALTLTAQSGTRFLSEEEFSHEGAREPTGRPEGEPAEPVRRSPPRAARPAPGSLALGVHVTAPQGVAVPRALPMAVQVQSTTLPLVQATLVAVQPAIAASSGRGRGRGGGGRRGAGRR